MLDLKTPQDLHMFFANEELAAAFARGFPAFDMLEDALRGIATLGQILKLPFSFKLNALILSDRLTNLDT
ncbi:hypothetical protein [Aureimonas pseudogalii]|uniref:hypothetical protein n=1 Tax=Aureimonas pseudogalii TaxID=1744844 RepID=UPI001AED7F6A|nr:hypothetical protein [Aureimonas pseudogalii]